MAATFFSVFLIAVISFTGSKALDQYFYNITVILSPGGSDQTGQLTLLMQGKPPQRRIVNLGPDNGPLPAGMVRSFTGTEVDYVPANEVSGLHIDWLEMDHGDTWQGTMLLEKVIVDPEYLKDKPEERKKFTVAFCPDPKDIPLKSWNFVILHRCEL